MKLLVIENNETKDSDTRTALQEFLANEGHEVYSISPENVLKSMGNDIPKARGRLLSEVCRQGFIADLILLDYDFGGWGESLTGKNIVRVFHQYPNKKFLGISRSVSDYTSVSFSEKLELSAGSEVAKQHLVEKVRDAVIPWAFRKACEKHRV